MGAYYGSEITNHTQQNKVKAPREPNEQSQNDLNKSVESVNIVKDSTNHSYHTVPSNHIHLPWRQATYDVMDDVFAIACDDPTKLSDFQLSLCEGNHDLVIGFIQSKYKMAKHKHEAYPNIFSEPHCTIEQFKMVWNEYMDRTHVEIHRS
eukprot:207257_1